MRMSFEKSMMQFGDISFIVGAILSIFSIFINVLHPISRLYLTLGLAFIIACVPSYLTALLWSVYKDIQPSGENTQ